MTKRMMIDLLGWGFILWFVGYILGIVLFMLIPPAMIGWVLMPVGTAITLWVLIKKIKGNSLKYYMTVSIVWTVTAIVLDHFFLVKLFMPADGYYKLDVYLYYALTFVLPLIVGSKKGTPSE